MLTRLDKALFWFTLNFAMIDFRTTMLLCIVVIGVGLGVLVSLAGSERLRPAQ
jgi:prepilin signal peptidase PulO-like enzyme (type II secretory pathway)